MKDFHIEEVMLVDDDAIVRMVTTKILRGIDFGGAMTSFENGGVAMDAIKTRFASGNAVGRTAGILVLLDINMPVLDGWGFLDEFIQLSREIKSKFLVVIVTSSVDAHDRVKAFSYPEVLDYITKPLSSKQLVEFITKHRLCIE
jgi:CheY-like chemotaxis protein